MTRDWPAEERYELGSQVRRSSNGSPANLAEKHSDRHIRNKIEGVNRPAAAKRLETCEPFVILQSLYRLRHGGHDVILFHVLDEAETNFPFGGMVDLEDPETSQRLQIDADAFRRDYLDQVEAFRKTYQRECAQSGVDYVPLDTSMPFDRALTEYLARRKGR